MANLKKHSIYFLVLLFLAMQGVGTLHFYLYHQEILPHIESERGFVVAKPELHHCDFYFFKTPLSLHNFEAIDYEQASSPYVDSSFNYQVFDVKKYKQTKYLRGPPVTLL